MRRERMNKRITIFLMAIMVLSGMLVSTTATAKAATTLPTENVNEGGEASNTFIKNTGKYSSWENKDNGFSVEAKYGFYPVQTDKTKISPFGTISEEGYEFIKEYFAGVNPVAETEPEYVYAFNANTSAKGSVGWKGTNFKIYNTETGVYDKIDAKVTISTWEAKSDDAYFFLDYRHGVKPQFNMVGILEAKLKIQYYVAGTTKPYAVNSNFTYNDIDSLQYMGCLAEGVRNIFVSKTSKLKYGFTNNMHVFHYPVLGNDTTETPDLAFGATYSSDSLTILFGNAKLDDKTYKKSWSHFGFFANTMAFVEPPAPVKTVSDNDENKVNSNFLGSFSEKYTYNIIQNVPDGYNEATYYKSFMISDELEPCLEVTSALVKLENGMDVSENFNILIEKNKVIATANNVDTADFYNKSYNLEIKTKIKDGADLTEYTQEKIVTIPNKAVATINDNPQSSNDVTTKFNVPRLEIEKTNDLESGNVEKAVTSKEDKKAEKNSESPKTGDSHNMSLWISLITVGAIATTMTLFKAKK